MNRHCGSTLITSITIHTDFLPTSITNKHIHANTHTLSLSLSHTHTLSRTHTHKHHTCTHTHTNTHIFSLPLSNDNKIGFVQWKPSSMTFLVKEVLILRLLQHGNDSNFKGDIGETAEKWGGAHNLWAFLST